MKKFNTLFAAMLIAGATVAQTNWTLDKGHSSVAFSVAHMVVSETTGNFKDFDVKAVSKSEDFVGAEVEFTAKTASVFTDNEKRDGHLKSDDFFNAEKFPEIKFKGTIVKEGGKYLLKGNLTMRDVTKPVTFDLTYGGKVKAYGGEKAGFKFTGKVNRQEFGLKFNKALEGGGLVVGDEVEFTCKIELNKAA
ncbi:MAG: YceI family protein [Cytophagales bacterium]|jgi:polyisoprenoid-binding protein YceI|nr:YceI family protein [Cytophagales bacterium]MCA6388361.1 YceI family protein [Cytophagales bacterium]MCA6391317.1 YceI family protein [Cytophagales bacterium]MCA6394627.1 YceI family protein [Cytophagales bacterium]MCA6397257.1 YceI family protein [Cytophagales bacterium]